MLEENQDDHFINWPKNIPLDPELEQVKKLVFDRFDNSYRNIWISLVRSGASHFLKIFIKNINFTRKKMNLLIIQIIINHYENVEKNF